MSENGLNNSSNPMEQVQGNLVPAVVKPVPQYQFNGITSHDSSRGSLSSYVSSIPSSQLPPSRIAPTSHPPINSTINLVTQKVSQLSVQNQFLSNVIKPPFTSTPNRTVDLHNQNVIEDMGDSSIVSPKVEDKPNTVQPNFQEIPLNDDKPVSNTNHTTENIPSTSEIKSFRNMNLHEEHPKPLVSNVFDARVSEIKSMSSNSQVIQNQSRNLNDTAKKTVQPFTYPQTSLGNMNSLPVQKNSAFQQLNPYPPVTPQIQSMKTTQNNSSIQSKPAVVSTTLVGQTGKFNQSNFTGPLNQNIEVSGYAISQNPKRGTFSPIPSNQMNNMQSGNRMASNNFPVQKQPMGSNAFLSQPMNRPNFNLNPVVGPQPQNRPQSVNQPDARISPMPPKPQAFQSSFPGYNSPEFAPDQKIIQQHSRMPIVNQVVAPPLSLDNSPSITKNSSLHSNRYPSLPAQRVPSLPNMQPAAYQQYQNQPIQNQTYNPTHNLNQFSNQHVGHNVVQQGFNKLWGVDNEDLLQKANILPPTKIVPPQIYLGNEVLNAANCSSEIFRSTITKIPESQSLLQKSRLPLGILIHPFKDLIQLSVIQCNVIVRCRACRTYINPFVLFVDSKRWKCNLCYRVNDLPEEFQYDPVSKTYGDPSRRPEIKSSTIEYIAPAEYMLRPPQPAVYLFLLDVSRLAVESGYLNLFCNILQEELVNLPGDTRTQVGFITYNSYLHFFMFAEGLSQPHEMTILDIDDVFLPSPDNLLVNLKDRLELIRDLLSQLPTRYSGIYDSNSALGAALQAAHRMLSPTGGRVTVFQATLPNVGPGALLPREDPNQRSSAEVQNLKPANDFYKRLALDCSSQQIAVDLFIVNSQYVDIATISGISRFSGGCIHHFPLFKFGNPIMTDKLEKCLRRYMTRKIGFEAVMRIRCTRGMSIHTFHGNFFVRSTDLLSLPNVNPDAGYGMQVSIDENLSDVESVCFQAALLYTSSKGERRIRVHTLCLPVVSTLHDVLNSADQQCIIGLLAKMAVDRSIESSLSDAREAFINVAIDILSSYKLSLNLGSTPNGLLAPNCLKLLPLYISALLKNPAFRTGTSTRLDDRVKAMIDMKTTPLPWLMKEIYPDLYPIHNLEEQQVILNLEEEQIHMPPLLQLTSRLVDNNGAYLMDTSDHMLIYICSGVSEVFLREGLGVPNFINLNDQMYEIPVLETQTNKRLISFIKYLNEDKPFRATIQVIKDNSPSRGVFLERLIEDRVENALSYHEFLQHVKAQVK